MALVVLHNDLLREVNGVGGMTLLVLLDLSAPFDTVNHGTLLDRMMSLGTGRLAHCCLRSFPDGLVQLVDHQV